MKTPETGPDLPKPALVGGLSQHGTFEGDMSMTRVDAFLGDQVVFNETPFQQFINISTEFGFSSTYDINAAAELRHERLLDSIRATPTSSSLPSSSLRLIWGRLPSRLLRRWMPDDFFRQPAPVNFGIAKPLVNQIFTKHPFTPGVNYGVNNFVLLPNTPALSNFCGIYENIALRVVPHPIKNALNKNLGFFFGAVSAEHNCAQVFPFGR
ncbi:hypothetical protein M422DRAFT_277125 [Sphaerobolus stellatus SS14]|uniref:Heme haloperoxidase family profile domain-containing protein n=1 Tax=Sphaerobolus stellatus (strain SS14) TaxID=990650 RepID=A0A0C9U0H8_SPHS4|nr:hypothetical protein M422DRAFT_277125 [Sphaerobolus stellatus SS14]